MKILQDTLTGPYERALKRGRDEISNIVSGLRIRDEGSLISCASWFHRLAEDKEFTKGRKIPHVAVACLYLACKTCKMNYLLIDFSNYLQINVYLCAWNCVSATLSNFESLGAQNYPEFSGSKFFYPSIYRTVLDSYDCMDYSLVYSEFTLLVFSDQTGRIPSGLCGAALYMSALSHGLDPSKSNIVSVIYVCEVTLTGRLIGFEESSESVESSESHSSTILNTPQTLSAVQLKSLHKRV
ncbi:transcription factor IIIB 90 kDa subunit-like [Zingiber officinale]|uniref:transcription factor IIIB 90 kDa subunit-like n=1 Tax=Zingiber officinale TaxID=94328 RepID=UPI001C4ABD13|nr:transcription factor IIIB 90 kDa subunit-like [Zingiber officinale]